MRTFDGCFGRIPDRPGRAPVLADVVVVLAGLIGIGGLFGGDRGLDPGDLGLHARGGPRGRGLHRPGRRRLRPAGRAGRVVDVSGRRRRRPWPRCPRRRSPDRKSFAIRWWEAFRLVLLLAIGPALVALALATAPMAFRVATKVKPLPGGGSVRIETNPAGDTYVTTTDASGRATIRLATDAEIAEAGPAPPTQTRGALLPIAALATVTVLAHGAAFVSLGAALGVWIRRRARAIAASVGLVLFVTVGWPIVYLNIFGDPNDPRWGLALASVLPAFGGLLFHRDRPGGDREHERMGRLLGRDPDPVGRRHLGAGDPHRGPQVPRGILPPRPTPKMPRSSRPAASQGSAAIWKSR